MKIWPIIVLTIIATCLGLLVAVALEKPAQSIAGPDGGGIAAIIFGVVGATTGLWLGLTRPLATAKRLIAACVITATLGIAGFMIANALDNLAVVPWKTMPVFGPFAALVAAMPGIIVAAVASLEVLCGTIRIALVSASAALALMLIVVVISALLLGADAGMGIFVGLVFECLVGLSAVAGALYGGLVAWSKTKRGSQPPTGG